MPQQRLRSSSSPTQIDHNLHRPYIIYRSRTSHTAKTRSIWPQSLLVKMSSEHFQLQGLMHKKQLINQLRNSVKSTLDLRQNRNHTRWWEQFRHGPVCASVNCFSYSFTPSKNNTCTCMYESLERHILALLNTTLWYRGCSVSAGQYYSHLCTIFYIQ